MSRWICCRRRLLAEVPLPLARSIHEQFEELVINSGIPSTDHGNVQKFKLKGQAAAD